MHPPRFWNPEPFIHLDSAELFAELMPATERSDRGTLSSRLVGYSGTLSADKEWVVEIEMYARLEAARALKQLGRAAHSRSARDYFQALLVIVWVGAATRSGVAKVERSTVISGLQFELDNAVHRPGYLAIIFLVEIPILA